MTTKTSKTLQRVCLTGALVNLNTVGAYCAFANGQNIIGAFIVVCFGMFVACWMVNTVLPYRVQR